VVSRKNAKAQSTRGKAAAQHLGPQPTRAGRPMFW